jgi:hypothetical protein
VGIGRGGADLVVGVWGYGEEYGGGEKVGADGDNVF